MVAEGPTGVVAFAASFPYSARPCYAGVNEFSVYVARECARDRGGEGGAHRADRGRERGRSPQADQPGLSGESCEPRPAESGWALTRSEFIAAMESSMGSGEIASLSSF